VKRNVKDSFILMGYKHKFLYDAVRSARKKKSGDEN
jgi:hypothetical protein